MVRHRGGRGVQIPFGLTAGFVPKRPTAINPEVFSFQQGTVGNYMNPYQGKQRTQAMCRPFQQCCNIDGCCTSPDVAYQKAKCLSHTFNIIFLTITVCSLINWALNTDKTLVVIGSLIAIGVNSIFFILNSTIYCNRKNLFKAECSVCCTKFFAILVPSMLFAPGILLGVFSHQTYDMPPHGDSDTTTTYPWSASSIILLILGISTPITGILYLSVSTCGYMNWLVDPRVLEERGNKITLQEPIFAADTRRNPGAFNLVLDLINRPVQHINQEYYRFSYDPQDQLQLFGALIRQRAKMIQEINSLVDGSGGSNNMMAGIVQMNPMLAYNPMMAMMMNNPAIQNPHLMTFSPLITEDFQVAKMRAINERLLSWKGTPGFYEIGGQPQSYSHDPNMSIHQNNISRIPINMNASPYNSPQPHNMGLIG